MINRINLLLRAKNITARTFAEEIGIQPSGMSHILSGRNNPSLDFVTKVIRRYPEISLEWLVFGQGEMLKSPASPTLRPAAIASTPSTDPTTLALDHSIQQSLTFDAAELEDHPKPEVQPSSTDTAAHLPIDHNTPSMVGTDTPAPEKPLPIPSVGLVAGKQAEGKRIAKIILFYDDHTFETYENCED